MIETNVRTKAPDTSVLSGAILLYTGSKGSQTSFATVHQIQMMGEVPQIMPGRPMTEADKSELYEGLNDKACVAGVKWIPTSVLAQGPGRMIWWTPPMKRSMFFKKSSMNKGTFDGRNVCPVPGMVWAAVSGQGLYVYAVKGADRPTEKTALFQAPLFNVWSSGKVCSGNASQPKGDQAFEPEAWEKFFFGSEFSHPNFTQRNRLIKGQQATSFWSKMVKEPSESFPDKALVPVDLRVEDLLSPVFLDKLASWPRAQGEF